jgi:hypothetical protein
VTRTWDFPPIKVGRFFDPIRGRRFRFFHPFFLAILCGNLENRSGQKCSETFFASTTLRLQSMKIKNAPAIRKKRNKPYFGWQLESKHPGHGGNETKVPGCFVHIF